MNKNYKESLNAIIQENSEIRAQFIELLTAFNRNAMDDTIQGYLNHLKNQIDIFEMVVQALTDADYINNPINKPWKLIILLLIHMSTLDNSISYDDQKKLSRIIAALPQDCQDEIKRQINGDDGIYNLLYSAGFNQPKNQETIPAYFQAINNILKSKIDFTQAEVNLDLNYIVWMLDSMPNPQKTNLGLSGDGDFVHVKKSSTDSQTAAIDFLSIIKNNSMMNDDWISLTEALVMKNASIIINDSFLKYLIKNNKADILNTIRSSPELQETINDQLKDTQNQTGVYPINDRYSINTTNPLFSMLATSKHTQAQQGIGKTKSSLELCSIMGWTIGKRRDPKEYLHYTNDELLDNLIQNVENTSFDAFKNKVEATHEWLNHANEKLHAILLTLACTNASFKDQTEVVNNLLSYDTFKVDAFITHLLDLANDPKNWPNLQTMLPLTAYLLAKTEAKHLTKGNLQGLSHREFKLPILFAIKNHFPEFSTFVDRSKNNALNAVIDFHQWKPTLFVTKTRASIEAVKAKNNPDKAPKSS